MLNKRLGQISEGKEAWLKHCQRYGDGRIHGSVLTNATVSGRCSHRSPNLGQIPRVGQPYGAECRSCFMLLMVGDRWELMLQDLNFEV